MLEINVPAIHLEFYDELKEQFINVNFKAQTLELEHSLVSISKWESHWCKPFLDCEKTKEELTDYIRCMTINSNKVENDVYEYLPTEVINQINNYINAPMTATIIKKNGKNNGTFITSELIYYWMVSFQIPIECEKWHLKRLMTLISICDEKNKPQKKMTQQEIIARNAEINARNKARFNSKG